MIIPEHFHCSFWTSAGLLPTLDTSISNCWHDINHLESPLPSPILTSPLPSSTPVSTPLNMHSITILILSSNLLTRKVPLSLPRIYPLTVTPWISHQLPSHLTTSSDLQPCTSFQTSTCKSPGRLIVSACQNRLQILFSSFSPPRRARLCLLPIEQETVYTLQGSDE